MAAFQFPMPPENRAVAAPGQAPSRYGTQHNMEELAGISQKEFTDRLMSSMKLVAYVWTRLQAEKKEAKRHKAKEDRSDTDGYERFKDKNGMTVEAERCTRIEIDNEDISKKREWAVRLLNKLWKDIAPHDREHFVRSITGTLGSEPPRCVLTIGDHTSKMRRIDCFRQSNKVWRLDLICMVLFRGLPLESTDAERLGKHCNKEICLQPHHMYVNVREFDMVMAKVLAGCEHEPLLQLENKTAYDMGEYWNSRSVPLVSANGYASVGSGSTYTEAMSVSPPVSAPPIGARPHSTASVPIPSRAYKRSHRFAPAFDEDGASDDTETDRHVATSRSFDSSYSSPKIKVEGMMSPVRSPSSFHPPGTMPVSLAAQQLSFPGSMIASHPEPGPRAYQMSNGPFSMSVDSGFQNYASGRTESFTPLAAVHHIGGGAFNNDSSIMSSPSAHGGDYFGPGSHGTSMDISANAPPLMRRTPKPHASGSTTSGSHSQHELSMLGSVSDQHNSTSLDEQSAFFNSADMFGGRPHLSSMPVSVSYSAPPNPTPADMMSGSAAGFMNSSWQH